MAALRQGWGGGGGLLGGFGFDTGDLDGQLVGEVAQTTYGYLGRLDGRPGGHLLAVIPNQDRLDDDV